MAANLGHGLLATPKDRRDFPLGGIVGHASPSMLPKSYSISDPLVIKDQGPGTDMCAAYALTAVSEDQEGIILDPLYTFARTRQIMGVAADSWGSDLRSACKSAVKPYGFLKGDAAIVSAPANMTIRDESLTQFPREKDSEAADYRKESFFAVTGPYDFFDQVRSALWQTRDEERSVLTGIDWRPEWTPQKDGYITDPGGNESYGHAIKIFGFETIASIDFLVAQLSNGKEIGRGGIFSLSRGIVNGACKYGAFSFLDLPRHEAEFQLGKMGWWRYWLNSIFV